MGKRKITKEQELKIVNLYLNDSKNSTIVISKLLNIKIGTVNLTLKRYNVKMRQGAGRIQKKYSFNESYLDKIDSEEKAYFLGFFYADGCNYKNKSVTLEIQEKDKYILEIFSKLFESNVPISSRKRNNINPNYQDMYSFRLHGRKIAERLCELGCPPNKTYSLNFPTEEQVPSHLVRHFIRGYLDGDGTIHHKSRKGRRCFSIFVGFFSYLDFLVGLQQLFEKELDILPILQDPQKKGKKVARALRINKRKDIIKLLNWIYRDSKIHLIRKYEKYQNILKEEQEKIQRELSGDRYYPINKKYS